MSTTFSAMRDDIITAALKECGAIGAGETASSQDFSDASFSLNLIIKSWLKKGMPLWKVVEVVVPTVASNTSYQIGSTASGTGAVVTDRPLRVLNAFARSTISTMVKDISLQQWSRQEYEDMGAKSTLGVPNSFYYQALGSPLTGPNGLLLMYPTPADTTYVVHLFVQIPISDVVNGTDLVDFPSECYQALKWALAAEVCGPYVSSMAKIQRIEQKAAQFKVEMEDWSVEEASMYFGRDYRER